jgi:hypothetical protein
MLEKKLLVDVGVDTFTGKNRYWRRKSATHSAGIASFCPLAVTSGPGPHLGAFSSLEQGSYWRWGPRSLRGRSVLAAHHSPHM